MAGRRGGLRRPVRRGTRGVEVARGALSRAQAEARTHAPWNEEPQPGPTGKRSRSEANWRDDDSARSTKLLGDVESTLWALVGGPNGVFTYVLYVRTSGPV